MAPASDLRNRFKTLFLKADESIVERCLKPRKRPLEYLPEALFSKISIAAQIERKVALIASKSGMLPGLSKTSAYRTTPALSKTKAERFDTPPMIRFFSG